MDTAPIPLQGLEALKARSTLWKNCGEINTFHPDCLSPSTFAGRTKQFFEKHMPGRDLRNIKSYWKNVQQQADRILISNGVDPQKIGEVTYGLEIGNFGICTSTLSRETHKLMKALKIEYQNLGKIPINSNFFLLYGMTLAETGEYVKHGYKYDPIAIAIAQYIQGQYFVHLITHDEDIEQTPESYPRIEPPDIPDPFRKFILEGLGPEIDSL